MMFTGEFERKLDSKGRMALPPQLRDQLGKHLKVFPALEADALYLFAPEAYEPYVMGLFEKKGGYNERSEQDQRMMRLLNSRTRDVDVDSAGRIMLSKEMRAAKGVGSEAVLVGNGNRAEIWDTAAWEAFKGQDSDEDLRAQFFA